MSNKGIHSKDMYSEASMLAVSRSTSYNMTYNCSHLLSGLYGVHLDQYFSVSSGSPETPEIPTAGSIDSSF